MLIPFDQVFDHLEKKGIKITGILHIGAHMCEELDDYEREGITDIEWVEANPELAKRMCDRGIFVHNAAISDTEAELPFYVTNNGQSSSLLEFGTHAASYPWCKVTSTITVHTETLENLIVSRKIAMAHRNFWNLDIQGAELRALKSAGEFLRHADAIYAEVNTQEVYKGCGLLHELDAFLGAAGFERQMISMTGAGWGDALYVRSAAASRISG
jgi:FkbM family methyltransferase